MNLPALWKCALLGVLFASTASVSVAEGKGWKTPDFLVASFVEVAMRSDYSSRQTAVRKWVAPISYFIVQNVGDEDLHGKMIGVHFEHLAEITGLPIQSAASLATANFLVVLTSEEKLEADMLRFYSADAKLRHEAAMRHSMCLVTFATERRGAIVRAVAMIPVDRARSRGDLVSCIVEELTHAMGLPNDSVKNIPSIFSRQSGRAFLSGLDLLMLKMLYDPRVKPGMSEKVVLPILRTIAVEYERDKRFEPAEGIAAESGLSRLSP